MTLDLANALGTRQVTVSSDWELEIRSAETGILPGSRLGEMSYAKGTTGPQPVKCHLGSLKKH